MWVRRWAIRIAIACLALEVVYLIAGNLCIHMGVLENVINYEPEMDFVSWESGFTVFPGYGTFKGFSYRGQTRGSQTYVHLAKVNARVSVIGLLFKTVDIRGMDARDMDYRYRERIDYPCWTEESGEPFPGTPTNIEYYPEIPGLENPPVPKPEDIYPQEKKARPWTVKISGAHVEGIVQVAYNEIRITGEGSAKGGLTAILKESSAIDRGKVRLVPATVMWGAKMLTDDLDLEIDVKVEPFPTGCSEMSEIFAGTSGNLTIAGSKPNGFAMNVDVLTPLVPAQGMFSIESGTGELGGRFEKREGSGASGRLDLTRNVKGLDGTMDLGFGKGYVAIDDLSLTGDGVEILGWGPPLTMPCRIGEGRGYVGCPVARP